MSFLLQSVEAYSSCRGSISNGIDPLGGHFETIDLAREDMGVLLDDKGGDVANLHRPLLTVLAQHIATQAKLHGPSYGGGAIRVVIRIPLQANLGICNVLAPGIVGVVDSGLKARLYGLSEEGVKAFSGKCNRQHVLLIGALCPVASVHHPHKVRLEPAHA